ncbi:MAG: DUF393 domain-containing protein [Planctomycetes bacterium]|nr:DUF393 domain-containing protein [Planctomycetota bacterium]
MPAPPLARGGRGGDDAGMDAPPAGWVLYDASCGFCARWVPWWTPTFARVGLATAALQEPWVAARTGLAGEALLRDLVILLADGRLVLGADAYRWVLRRRWWGLPLWVLAALPPGRWLFDGGYRLFARNRHRVSHLCRLPPRPPP